MLLAKRPKAPKAPRDFNRQAHAARAKIRGMIARGDRPTSKDFDDEWSDFKDRLAEAQHGRCGYCDAPVLATSHGTIDHYRPKAEIKALLDEPTSWGTQKPHSASVTERKEQDVSELGYHWLAYAWSNYVFACSICNASWKKSFFPVRIHPRRCPPRPRGREDPLLLHCYGKLDPSKHLQFNKDGTVEARDKSPYGAETIRTVGLHRDPLCQDRKEVTERMFELLERYAEGEEAEAYRDILRLGNERRPFAGVARAILEQVMDMSWSEFVTLSA